MTATPSYGWSFSYWDGAASGSQNPTTITMNGDKTITAHFVQSTNKYTLTVISYPIEGGTVDLNPPGGVYDAGTVITLTAKPNKNYTFDHWTGAGASDEAVTTITINSDITVTAHFKKNADIHEYLPYIAIGAGVAVLIGLGYAFIRRRRLYPPRRENEA